MIREIRTGKNNPYGTNDRLPVRGQDGFYVDSTLDSSMQTDNTNTIFLNNVYDKVTKLEAGESDPKKKARLIEIATRNLGDYFKNGGPKNGSIKVVIEEKKKKKVVTVTVADLQKRLEPYQK